MNQFSSQGHWGESPELKHQKYEIDDVFLYMPPEKKTKIESIEPVEDEEESDEKFLIIKNEIVTQTIELMTSTNTIKTMMRTYNEERSDIKPPLPTITLSPETQFCLSQLNRPGRSTFHTSKKLSDFCLGKPKTYPVLSKPVALEAISKSLCGLLRVKGFEESTESALLTFVEGVEEFFKCFIEKVNNMVLIEDKAVNKTMDIISLERAYTDLTGSSLTQLHNYYKHEVINRNRFEITRFMETHEQYKKLAEESENVSNIMLKQEYENIIGDCEQRDFSPSSSNMNDSDASSFSYQGSSYSYNRQQSDDNSSIY